MEHFAKGIMPEWRHANRNCSGQGGSVELRHFDKHFVKTQEKKVLQGNILEFFLICTIKTTFWMDNLTQGWTQPGPFFEKSGDFNWFSKKGRGSLPHSPLVLCLWVWPNIHLNMNVPKYPWECLNKLFWLCQGSEYAW